MRASGAILLLLLVLVTPAAADDEPTKPVKEMTGEEKKKALEELEQAKARIASLRDQAKYAEATEAARQALKITERVYGPNHRNVAFRLSVIAQLLESQGEYEKAGAIRQRALSTAERAFGPQNWRVIAYWNHIANLREKQGALDEAAAILSRVVELSKQAYGSTDRRVAGKLEDLAGVLARQDKHEEARHLYEGAATIYEKTLGPDSHTLAMCLSSLGMVLVRQGRYRPALPIYERVVAIEEKVFGRNHPAVGTALGNLAFLLRSIGEHEAARVHFDRTISILEAAYGADDPRVATSRRNLADLLYARGSYEQARQVLGKALASHEKALGSDHLEVALDLNSLAMVLKGLGLPGEARPLYRRALAIISSVHGPDHAWTAGCMSNLAALQFSQGLHEEATLLLRRALAIHERVYGPLHVDVATSLNNLAVALSARGSSAEADSLCRRALSILEERFGSEHPDVAANIANLAGLRARGGAYKEAQCLLERALAIQEKTLGPDHPDTAHTLNNLASALAAQGIHEKAIALLQKALARLEKALDPRHVLLASTLNNLGVAMRKAGQHALAHTALQRCLRASELGIRSGFMGLVPSERRTRALTVRAYLHELLELAPLMEASGYPEVLRLKGLVARASAAERRLAARGDETTRSRVRDLRAAERRLARLANSMPPTFKREKKKAWREAYAKAAAEREELALALQRDFAPLRQGLERLDLALPDVQARLGPDAVLLDFLRSGEEYIAWVVRPEVEPERIDLGKAETIEEAAEAFVEATGDSEGSDWKQAGRALRALVFSPIARHLGMDVTTIHVCPDAALAAVPLAALPGRTDESLLLDDYLVSTVSMAQDLVPWEDAPEPGQGALLLGGVDYGEAAVGEEEEKAESAFVDRAPRGSKFMYLKGTKAEAETIQAALGKGTTALFGKNATENRVRAQAKGRRVLHLATHGFVLDDLMRGLYRRKQDREWLGAGMERQLAQGHDPMLLAGLAMAGANPRNGGHGDDGILTALEASHLDLDGVELVVLSACQTALGKAESGEGVIGLVQGFQMAGAKRVIGSLWKVEDAATKALMVKFYELWSPNEGKGIGAAEALRKAQQYVRSQPKWKHPYYWAAWVIWGAG
jgi:CHAT domain-containing protein/Tfp pilus assembly protein PilF